MIDTSHEVMWTNCYKIYFIIVVDVGIGIGIKVILFSVVVSVPIFTFDFFIKMCPLTMYFWELLALKGVDVLIKFRINRDYFKYKMNVTIQF